MGGIAIKLNTAISGESILGTVTFKESDERKIRRYVTNYCEALGDTTYESEITAMFTSLVEEGLDSKLFALYPLIGNTLNKAKVNALNPGVNDAQLGGNASINNGELYFSSNIKPGALDDSLILTNTASFSMFTVAKKVATGKLSNRVYQLYGGSTSPCYLGTNGDGGAHIAVYNNSNNVKAEVSGTGTDVFYSYYVQNNKVQNGMLNGTSYNNTCVIDANFGLPNTILGGYIPSTTTLIPAGEQMEDHDSSLWNGYIYFHAIGTLTLAESATLKSIVATFLSNVRNVNI